jgi:nitric oxide synthase-interacting protein
MQNLLSQRQEIKRFEKELEREKKDDEESDVLEDQKVRERAVREFELVQMGLDVSKSGDMGNIITRDNGKVIQEKGEKRKFEIDEDDLLRIAKNDREKAKKALTEEKVHHPEKSYLTNSWQR